MIKTAKILTGVTLVFLAFLLLVLYSTNVQVRLVEFSSVPASQQAELAAELIETARRDDMGSDLFKRPTNANLDNYKLFTITVEVRNGGALPAEWLQLRVAPELGDVALFPGGAMDVPPLGGTRNITATLLSDVHTQETHRDIRLEYYVFGRRSEVAVPNLR